ncbi:MAG: sigma-70 family RNA polymerase sigma factor [Candidatus Buchananbacteria bacterium]|nr:sigma-70 family RNA polymerase sigma factor [Candidatus Buchananbacteria bacterium]
MHLTTEKQFVDFYDKHADAIFRFCYFRIYERELAKELSQESFCRLWGMVAEGQDITYPKAVLYRIARNLVIDYVRRKKEASLEEIQEVSGDSVFKDSKSEHIDDAIDVSAVLQKLREKNEELSEPLELKYLQGLQVKEIAKILNLSPNVVSVRIHRAIKILKGMYDN